MRNENTVISLQLPKRIVEDVKRRANKKGLSMTAYIRTLLIDHCESDNRNKGDKQN